jgi:acetyl esterase/lipase
MRAPGKDNAMSIGRRTFIAAGLAVPFAGMAEAAWPAAERIDLWPGDPPGQTTPPVPALFTGPSGPLGKISLKMTGVARPQVHVFRPRRPNGAGILVLPGGSYELLSVQNEGIDAAAGFTPAGYTVFLLTYRLPGEGWRSRSRVPLQDAQRAMRLIRRRASEFSLDPARLAVLGFSAGGHLAATLATHHDEAIYPPVDEAERQSARPIAAGLIYPVIDLHPPLAHLKSRDNLLGPDPAEQLVDWLSPQLNVQEDTPPCFLAHALDDRSVPAENSISMLNALRAKSIAAEAHLFETGGHGFGFMLPPADGAARWPLLFETWLGKHA